MKYMKKSTAGRPKHVRNKSAACRDDTYENKPAAGRQDTHMTINSSQTGKSGTIHSRQTRNI